jgi:hypothetical protein
MKKRNVELEIKSGIVIFILFSMIHLYISVFEYISLVVSYFIAKLTIYLFCKRKWYLKGIGLLLNLNLIFLFFLPKDLKKGLDELKLKESQ